MSLNFKTIKIDLNKIDKTTLLKTGCMGQKCEDFLTNIIFKNKMGVFLDIGAHDGVRFSNSYCYSQIGWKGICVEAHPDYYNLCKINRENNNTKVINCACNNIDNDSITFYSNYRGSLSTLNTQLNDFYKEHYKGYYVDKDYEGKVNNYINGPIKVKGLKLDTIINNNLEFLNNGNIDLLSIDVDGSEEYVLSGFDIMKYKPRVVILEISVVENIVLEYMEKTNYIKIYDNRLNVIYCRDIQDAILFEYELKKINHTIFSYDTGHPLD
tara:strand:- start:1035 stop:1838 length:804 start_codon:yes stop_codon:yes gene_type:complete